MKEDELGGSERGTEEETKKEHTRKKVKLLANFISSLMSPIPINPLYSPSNSSYVAGARDPLSTSPSSLKALISGLIPIISFVITLLERTNGIVIFAKSPNGLPSVQSSQSSIAITRGRVGWKIKLSSL